MSQPSPFRAIIACGGTGGHLFPGLAVAETLHDRGHEVLLFVSEKEIDATALRDHPEFRAEKLPSVGMPSNIVSPAFVGFIRRFWESYSQCKKIYRKFRPSVVLGMGGFTSTAPILAARMKGLPCFVHESNAIPGRANRLAAKFATSVLIGFEETRQRFPSAKCINTGTPVRRNLGSPLERAEAMKVFGLDPSRIVQIGIAEFANSVDYLEQVQAWGVTVITRDEVESRGVDAVVAQALAIAGAAGGPIHVDLDIDACDRSVAPACPASIPGGFSALEMRRFARGFARSDAVRSIDLAEVDVAQDSADGRTVRLTALCVLEALAGVVER
jgi:hypothetical protein